MCRLKISVSLTIFFVVAVFLLMSSCKKTYVQTENGIFVFKLYEDLTNDDIETTLSHLNQNIERMAGDLNVDLAGKKFTIHVWKTTDEFYKIQKRRTGNTYIGSTGYIFNKNEVAVLYTKEAKETAEHELAHVLSLHVNSKFDNRPRWYWESVAVYESNEFVSPKNDPNFSKGFFPSLEYLNKPFNQSDKHSLYELGYMLSDYVISEFGKEKYIELIRSNADIEKTLGLPTVQFESNWKAFMKEKYL